METAFDTLALHAGAVADPTTGALLTPIYQTTTYRQEAVGKDKGFTYSRSANPTVSALERRLAALEDAEYCTCYAPLQCFVSYSCERAIMLLSLKLCMAEP
jgi:O-acetylhomoserine/O-acetylserine sulfhydrylase-like pyridoxal-dependent enzyme